MLDATNDPLVTMRDRPTKLDTEKDKKGDEFR